MRRFRLPTLVAGLSVMAFGVWIMLDAAGTVDLTFAALGPAFAATLGLVLLTSGLEDRE